MEFNEITEKIIDFTNIESYYQELFFSNALAGEIGKYCNLIKKYYRDDKFNLYALRLELADIFIYLVLNARVIGIDLQQAILDKIKIVNKKR